MSVPSKPSVAEQARPAAAETAMAEGLLRGLAVRYPRLPAPESERLTAGRPEWTSLVCPAMPHLQHSSPVADALLRLTALKVQPPAASEQSPAIDDVQNGSAAVIGVGLTESDDTSAGEPILPGSEPAAACAAASAESRQPAAGQAPPDRRAFPRRESHCQVIVSRPGIDGPEGSARAAWQRQSAMRKGELLDISLSGAAFTLPEQPANGERLGLQLKKCHSHVMFETWATVVRTAREETGECWQVFCRFERTLPFEQVVHFGYSLNRSSVV